MALRSLSGQLQSKQKVHLLSSWTSLQVRQSSSAPSMIVFDRQLKQRQRAWSMKVEDSTYYDYLRTENAVQICDRIEDISRNFPAALELGSHRGHLFNVINSRKNLNGTTGGVGGIETLYQYDSSFSCPEALENNKKNLNRDMGLVEPVYVTEGDEEDPLSFAEENSLDMVVSSLSMHWINDLPQALKKIQTILKPDGVFIGSLLGGSTLQELRYCFYLVEQERKGGLSPHTSPFVTPSDLAGLMQGARFTLPTIDVDTITISYPDAFSLMEHLSFMGEGTAALNRQFHVGSDTFLAVAALYQELYGFEDGSIPATFQIIHTIGWAPDASQPVACKRGSASRKIGDMTQTVDVTETKQLDNREKDKDKV